MYKSGYVVSVRQGGQTVPELGDRVSVAFNEEYELRLRNKNGKDTIAFIYIDGKVVVEDGLIIPAHKFIDLERYVSGGDLLSGRRFKFVPLESGQVKDKSEPENGIIEVRFHEEKDAPKIQLNINNSPPNYIFSHHCHSSHCLACGRMHCTCCPCNPTLPWGRPRRGEVWCSSVDHGASQAYGGQAVGAMNLSARADVSRSYGAATSDASSSILREIRSAKAAEAGATVEGSLSNQKFGTRQFEYVKETSTILTLKLVGFKKEAPQGAFCQSCGTKRTGKFCTGCGDLLLP